MPDPVRVLFLVPYPLHRAPSQRFRVENLLPVLDAAGINYTLRPFMNEATWNILYKGGSALQKVKGILKGFAQRWKTVRREAKTYDYIFIHREAAPLGPPVFEWYLKKVLKKKIIFDFDDAIWIPNTSAENKIAALVKAFWKIPYVLKWSYKISAGNDYLCSYAKQHTQATIVRTPTVVDTTNRYNRLQEHSSGKPATIGWTGSHSTLKYINEVIPVLQQLQEEHDFCFVVIADKEPQLPLKNWKFIPWNAATEIEDLMQIGIGIMPLTPDPWSEGKCGFKLIQYLSLGIPALATPVGVNSVIIEEGVNGYICKTSDDWHRHLTALLNEAPLRRSMGEKGRQKMVAEYSIDSLKPAFTSLFS
ncbi:glycosyltransferase [Chitinophagaceae bacterium MMS25-I14]